MKYLISLACILFAASSCSKNDKFQVQDAEPVTSNSNNTLSVTFDTIGVVLTRWSPLQDNEYISVVMLPSQTNYDPVNEYLQFYIDYLGRYQEITGDPINYSGGKLWCENYSGEHVVYFQSDDGNLPFDSLEIDAIITIEHY
jgi:hypothetical protein